jgi:hypothetical protein
MSDVFVGTSRPSAAGSLFISRIIFSPFPQFIGIGKPACLYFRTEDLYTNGHTYYKFQLKGSELKLNPAAVKL